MKENLPKIRLILVINKNSEKLMIFKQVNF